MSPGQHNRNRADSQFENHRILVPHALPFPVRRRRMEDADLHRSVPLAISGLHDTHYRVCIDRGRLQFAQLDVRRNRHALPEHTRARIAAAPTALRRCDRDRHA